MKTVYIQRAMEDPQEDMERVEQEVDLFLDGVVESKGLIALADHLGA